MEHAAEEPTPISVQLERWLASDGERTLGGLIDFFGRKGFALVFVVLLGVPALPLPTGGATHVFEVVAMLLALQLLVGRERLWLPERWRRAELAGGRLEGFVNGLNRLVAKVERISRPRLRFLFHTRLSDRVFGLLVLLGSLAAFLAPPFTGLDTLPSLGVVVLSIGVVLEDALVVLAGVLCAAIGVVLEIVLGAAAIHGIGSLL